MSTASRLEVRGLAYDPWEHAEHLRLTVVAVEDMDASIRKHGERLGVSFRGRAHHVWGLYWHDLRLIEVHAALTPRGVRATLTHEIGHALAGDWPLASGWDGDDAEARAIAWATRHLVHPVEYAAAYLVHSETGLPSSVRNIALDLHVADHTIRDYRKLCTSRFG